ncbi:hypothetical protein DVH24_033373 [Malus domestica]|uniref:Uncharacterized protein n=1 Tax=Malus domestica TaxID=3750 RepID=A0A498JCF5_MALDO|nr:hypothetical protein DVH24_033373 [Malus domestica]
MLGDQKAIRVKSDSCIYENASLDGTQEKIGLRTRISKMHVWTHESKDLQILQLEDATMRRRHGAK